MRQQFQIERGGEESVDGCQFATVHEEAPRPTRPFGNCTKGLAIISLTCWNGTTCQRNIVCNCSCKMRSGRVGPRCRIISRLYFFNGAPFSFEARLIGTVCRENINYSTSSTSSIKKIYRLELQSFLAMGCPLASHTITLARLSLPPHRWSQIRQRREGRAVLTHSSSASEVTH